MRTLVFVDGQNLYRQDLSVRGQEKGVDVRLAVELVQATYEQLCGWTTRERAGKGLQPLVGNHGLGGQQLTQPGQARQLENRSEALVELSMAPRYWATGAA